MGQARDHEFADAKLPSQQKRRGTEPNPSDASRWPESGGTNSTEPTEWPDGPANAFADALRSAVAARGLALDRIRAHLVAAGHDLSIATLSYWQTGRSAPVRRSSIEAIGTLEVILRAPRGSLARALLEMQSARRALTEPSPEVQVPDHPGWLAHSTGAEAADAMIAGLGLTLDGDIDRVLQHDLLVMGADRRPVRHTTRDVVIARAPGVDRVVTTRLGGEAGRLALVTGRLGCRLGRSRVLPTHPVTVAELLLERPVPEGAAHVMEHDVHLVGGVLPMSWFSRAYLSHTQEGVIRVQFRRDDLPDRVGVYIGPLTSTPQFRPAPLRDGTLTVARQDFPPSQISLRWSWADTQEDIDTSV